MHSEMTSETGSTATDTGLLRYCMREDSKGARRGVDVPSADGSATTVVVLAAESRGAGRCPSRFMLKAQLRMRADFRVPGSGVFQQLKDGVVCYVGGPIVGARVGR